MQGRWFDGLSSGAREVQVVLVAGRAGPLLRLHDTAQPGAAPMDFVPGEAVWPERWSAGRVPERVVIDLHDRGSLEIDDVPAWQAALATAGERPPLSQRMQTRRPVFVTVLLLAVAGLWGFYRWGTPWAATQITRQVPLSWETSLSQQALNQLDDGHFKPSKLPAARQAQLRERFAQLTASITPELRRYAGYTPVFTLDFRSGMGPNALALPGGTVVMTDALVEKAAQAGLGDDALLGVLAHEAGHVVHRHTTRMVVEQGVLNAGLGMALGDLSGVFSAGASLLTGLAYRRSHEGEADCFAQALMRKVRLPTAPMGDLLLQIDASSGDGIATMLSSHPETTLRAKRLKEGTLDGC